MNLSPFLFSLYLNDLENFLIENGADGLCTITDIFHQDLYFHIVFFVLLYADDTVLLSESAEGLQKALDIFSEYCNIWKLKVNTKKTKVVVFCKRKSKTPHVFHFNGLMLDIVENYCYLGVCFNYNGKFTVARKKLVD